jgi:hypothetical protein
MLFSEITAVYYENYMKHANTFYDENAEFYYVKADGMYSNHPALKG